ncbi:MAG: Hint domain-containing protein, partial [Rhizobiales bacterium]|nr:Hint domain-containing protein [Hyphomicrobiales bacterium]
INIVNGSTTGLTFEDDDYQLFTPATGELVSLDGGTTYLTYQFLGYGDVRGDPLQHAAFIRVDLGGGSFQTFAIDMNADGDALPNLSTGNTKLQVANLDTSTPERFPAPACFVHGTLIRTADGPKAIENILPGEMVWTADKGMVPVSWIASETVMGTGKSAPIRFASGSFENTSELLVSPNHRMLLTGYGPQLYLGEDEVFVAAKHLVNGTSIISKPCLSVTYFHLLFEEHEIVDANGALTESYFLGDFNQEKRFANDRGMMQAILSNQEKRTSPTDLARHDARKVEAILLAA